MCSTAIFSLRGAARREEGGSGRERGREGKLVVWFGGARRAGFYRLAREQSVTGMRSSAWRGGLLWLRARMCVRSGRSEERAEADGRRGGAVMLVRIVGVLCCASAAWRRPPRCRLSSAGREDDEGVVLRVPGGEGSRRAEAGGRATSRSAGVMRRPTGSSCPLAAWTRHGLAVPRLPLGQGWHGGDQ